MRLILWIDCLTLCLNLSSGQLVISDCVTDCLTDCGRWGGSGFAPTEPWSLAGQGDRSPVMCQHSVCVCALEEARLPWWQHPNRAWCVWVCVCGCSGHIGIFLHICHLRFKVRMLSPRGLNTCFCLPDLAGAGAWRGSRCDARQGAELWHHLAGEREDHRAGVQEPAILPEAQGRQCHAGWVNEGHLSGGWVKAENFS